MKIRCIFIVITCLLLSGCGKAKVESLIKDIERIEENRFYFKCSQEIKEGEKKTINENSIEHVCSININNDTELLDKNNQALNITDFAVGNVIEIQFPKPQKISVNDKSFEVKKVILLEKSTE